jgi:hypothetical protein
MQCEIYFRDHCRFAEFGRRNCFYQHHKMQDRKPKEVEGSAEGKVD